MLGIIDEHGDKNEMSYWIATEMAGEMEDGLQSYQFPPAKWAAFDLYGPAATAVPHAWKKFFFRMVSFKQL